jgi:hypothetical protein
MRVQISSDGLAAYPDAFERNFGSGADYGQIVKTYSVTNLGKHLSKKTSVGIANIAAINKNVTKSNWPRFCLLLLFLKFQHFKLRHYQE